MFPYPCQDTLATEANPETSVGTRASEVVGAFGTVVAIAEVDIADVAFAAEGVARTFATRVGKQVHHHS